MRHIDLFSGIGGFALAARWTWGEEYENVGHSEIDKYAEKVYHKRFPTSQCLGDIREVRWQEGQCDLLTGGFPCQPHSVAGKRKASEDERDLWGECVRALRGIRPKYALFENVPGLLTSERGRFFNRVLADLAASGYDAEWQIISAASLGAPHRRERVWILCYPVEFGCEGVARRRARAILTDRYMEFEQSIIANSTSKRLEGTNWEEQKFSECSRHHRNPGWQENWTEVATRLCRVGDGVPNRVDRLRALGNAIVPQVAQVIFEAIKRYDKHK